MSLSRLNMIFSPHRRSFQVSSVILKKRKTAEERKLPPEPPVFKSKHKSTEVVRVWKGITVKELADVLRKDIDHILEAMVFVDNSEQYRKGHQVIDDFKVVQDVIEKSGKRFQWISKPVLVEKEVFVDLKKRDRKDYTNVKPRPPVVTIMGHVDHGKTTLLDALRESSIVDREFGGITQHIGAFKVKVGQDVITFLDTPGHAAFSSMRSRGAECTDIVVLVVAADDGVMEQTLESIHMAKNANVPIIVALNKIDKPKADPETTKRDLMKHGILVEELGGEIQVVPISALKRTNLDTLVDAILVQAEVMEVSADYSGPVEGVVVESCTDLHRGKLCTLLVQNGVLKKGQILVAGSSWCKVRAMFDDTGELVQEAGPATPVQTLGWRELPSAGDLALEVPSEKRAQQIISHREQLEQVKKAEQDQVLIDLKAQEHNAQYKEKLELKRKLKRFRLKPEPRKKEIIHDTGPRLNIIVKGDVDGSVEAILDVLDTYDSPKCKLDVVHYGVGPVSKNDLSLAEVFNAIVYAFNTKLLEPAGSVRVRNHNVIYKLMDDIKSEINLLLPPLEVDEVIGEANVLQEFLINEGRDKIPVAGSRCVKGSLKKNAHFRLVRSNETIWEGDLNSLRHLKNEVDSIKKDLECGIRISDPSVRFSPGDTIICYKKVRVSQKVDWDPGF